MIPPLHWRDETSSVDLLDQTALPEFETYLPIRTPEEMADAIRRLAVRGAPAIGIAAAYGTVLAVRDSAAVSLGDARDAAGQAIALLRTTRPTAVNLFHSLDGMQSALESSDASTPAALKADLLDAAHRIFEEDRAGGLLLGEHGLSLLEDGSTVLTHCHTGGVATSGYGTALAPLILAAERGKTLHAFVDETRPLLQGSRITAWELTKAGVDATLITDSMAGHVMQRGLVDAVIVGADRIAANGDTANKIGTYGLAVLAHAHGIPFYVSAPTSTIDMATLTGGSIEIEERAPEEVTRGFGRLTAPLDIRVYNPAFDVTPGRLITAIITERGILRPPFVESLAELMEPTPA
jgi:methylthioribose-1-phosphate isomerase